MVSKKVFFFLIGKNRHDIENKGGFFFIGNGAEIQSLEMGRKSPVNGASSHQGLHCLQNTHFRVSQTKLKGKEMS